ncbi:uncharacterized protein LOC117642570 isoform X2 [Thrips palmi]|uniref:Uncharacterized protein LOC117642570 isoform X2 n=1 Tax=Thrips palmi TaxID=161013 RepID=A0A6P8ZKA3_THRPL|nr:uncharacterized protein LOC117642570 isoform X2 [Thrips palmi]
MAWLVVVVLALSVGAAVLGAPATSVSDFKIAEVTNETIRLEWSSPAVGKQFSVGLVNTNSTNESQNLSIKSESDTKCSIEFSDLKPLTKYRLTITNPEKEEVLATVETMTPPSLEMPEIEEVQEGCAHLTLAPLPEEQAKDVEAYLLLVRPLEDAKDYPAADIKDPNLQSKLEALVKPPFYLAYEFTQEELSNEDGGQVQIGTGAAKKEGKYGSLQDPRLTSGGNYRVAFVAIMNLDGKQSCFSEESCQMLVK